MDKSNENTPTNKPTESNEVVEARKELAGVLTSGFSKEIVAKAIERLIDAKLAGPQLRK